MDNGTVGSDIVSEELTFASSEHVDLQSDLKDQSQNNLCMETDERQSEREHSETGSNNVRVKIQSCPSPASDFLAQSSIAMIAASELICGVFNSDSHLAEPEAGREELQRHLSENVLVSLVSQESEGGCGYGKRVLESMESCQPAYKRSKTGHEFEGLVLVTAGAQSGISGEAGAGNRVVSVNVMEVENAELSKPVSSVVEIISSTFDKQADNSHKPQTPLSFMVNINPSTFDIQTDESYKPQEPITMDCMARIPECRQQIEMTSSKEPVSQPNPKCLESLKSIENPNIPENSSSIEVSSNPSVKTLIAPKTDEHHDRVSESASDSVALAKGTSESQQQSWHTPRGIKFPESGIRNEDTDYSRAYVPAGEKFPGPFEISMVIDNLIRRELEDCPVLEPLSSVVEVNASTFDIHVDDFIKPQEPLCSVVESNLSIDDIHDDDSHKPQAPLSSVVEINPSTFDIQTDKSYKPQEPITMDCMARIPECRQQIEMTSSKEPVSQPNPKCLESLKFIENPNIPENSSSIEVSSKTLIALETDDHHGCVSESVSDSMALAPGTSKSQQQQSSSTPLGIIFPESDIRNDDPDFSGGEKFPSPFEISMVIDNLIRRELEASDHSHTSEGTSDDDDLGDEDSRSGEKMDEDDEEESSRADSESSLRVKEIGGLSIETKDHDQNPVLGVALSHEKDELIKTTVDSKTNELVADETQSILNLDKTSLNVDSDIDKEFSKTFDKAEDRVKDLDVQLKQYEQPSGQRIAVEATPVKGSDLVGSELPNGQLVLGKATPVKGSDLVGSELSSGQQVPGESTPVIGNDLVGSELPSIPCEATFIKESDLVGSVEYGNKANLTSEVVGTLMQESSFEKDLSQNTVGSMAESSDLPAGDDAKRGSFLKQQLGTETALECTGESLAPASATGEVTKKLYDPFEDMEIVDEDAATDEDGFTLSDEASDKTKAGINRVPSERGARGGRGASVQGGRYRKSEDNQGHEQYGTEREDQTHWPRDDQWPREEQAQWPVDEQASWYNQSNDGKMYEEGRMAPNKQPLLRLPANYGPSGYDPGSGGSFPSYGMPPQSSVPQPWPAQGYAPPPAYMPPYPGTMPQPGGYGAPMPYGGMTMPPYYGQWGQWPPAAPVYPMIQQQQQQQQQQGQSYQDWQNWWQNYSTWYSSYMSGWNQPPANQQMDYSHYQSQGSWSTANQQYAPPPPISEAPPPLPPPQPKLPSAKHPAKNISSVTKADIPWVATNPKVSYRPTVAKGPILNSTGSGFTPSAAPRLKFSISGPGSVATTKSAPLAKPSEPLSTGKDLAAGERNEQETGNNIWVGNLPLGTSAVDVRTLISKHGKVVKCKVGAMKSQKDAGLAALVTMETAEDVAVCIQMLHEAYYNGQKILVRKLKQQ